MVAAPTPVVIIRGLHVGTPCDQQGKVANICVPVKILCMASLKGLYRIRKTWLLSLVIKLYTTVCVVLQLTPFTSQVVSGIAGQRHLTGVSLFLGGSHHVFLILYDPFKQVVHKDL